MRQVSCKVEPLPIFATVATIALVIKHRTNTMWCGLAHLAEGQGGRAVAPPKNILEKKIFSEVLNRKPEIC